MNSLKFIGYLDFSIWVFVSKYFQMLLEKFKFCQVCILLELSKPYLKFLLLL